MYVHMHVLLYWLILSAAEEDLIVSKKSMQLLTQKFMTFYVITHIEIFQLVWQLRSVCRVSHSKTIHATVDVKGLAHRPNSGCITVPGSPVASPLHTLLLLSMCFLAYAKFYTSHSVISGPYNYIVCSLYLNIVCSFSLLTQYMSACIVRLKL